MNADTSKPMTAAQRVAKANQALIARGGRRMPSGYLQPETAEQLARLVESGYAAAPLAAIARAIQDAHSARRL